MIRKLVRNFTRGLLLRNGIFYFRMDIKVSGNKYKSIRRSLHTADFHTAIQKAEQMKRLVRAFSELSSEEQADFIRFYTRDNTHLTEEEKRDLEINDGISIISIAFDVWQAKRADGGELIDRYIKKSLEFDLADRGYMDSAFERMKAKRSAGRDVIDAMCLMHTRKKFYPEEEQDYEETLKMAENSCLHDMSWEEYKARQAGIIAPRTPLSIQPQQIAYQEPPKPQNKHTIGEIMRYMFQVSQIKSETQKSQEYDVQNMVASVGLGLEDDFSELNDQGTINKICTWVKERRHRYIKQKKKQDVGYIALFDNCCKSERTSAIQTDRTYQLYNVFEERV